MAEVTFGEWLKRRRNGLGLTQKQLALQINCSTSALRKFEGETRRPSTRVLGAISAFHQKLGDHNFDPRPIERYYDLAEAHTRKVLGHTAFASAFAEGQKMSLDEALDLVLKSVEEM